MGRPKNQPGNADEFEGNLFRFFFHNKPASVKGDDDLRSGRFGMTAMNEKNPLLDEDMQAPNRMGAIAALQHIMTEIEAEGANSARLGDILNRLDERAFGLLLLLLALPCCLPFIYLLPQIVALPMLALAGQLAMGKHHPWLPKKLNDRSFEIASFKGVLDRAEKYVGWVERLAKPRFLAASGHVGARVVGMLLLIPTASILVPLPSTNTIPGIGVAIASVGLIERDGVLIVMGLIIGFAWVALLVFLGAEAAQFIKDWLSARL